MSESNSAVFTRRDLLVAAAATAIYGSSAGVGMAGETPVRGGVLTITQANEPPMLVSAFNPSTYVTLVSTKIHEGLVAFDANQRAKPHLAESWEIAPDGRSYTFRLRRGVTWHDGVPFTAADVAFSAREVWSKLHPRSNVTWGALEAVETPDDQTVIFRLSRPVPFLLSMLGAWDAQIIAKHVYEKGDIRTNPANNAPIGTGPFIFKEWQRGQYVRLARNPDYWQQGKPYLDEIIIRMMPDAGSRAAALEAKEVQIGFFTPVPLSDMQRLLALPHLAVETHGYEMFAPMIFMEVNTRNEYLKDRRVRQAIMHALDRKFILDNIYYGYGKIATSPLTTASPFYTSEGVPQYGFDPARANALLDEAGFARKSGKTRFKITTELTPSPEFTRLSEYFKQALARVGIEVEIRSSDLPTFLRRVYTDYDFNVTEGFIFMLPDPSAGVQRLYYGPNIRKGVAFANATGYANPELDKIWEAALVETDTVKRKALFAEAQRVVQTDLPVFNVLEMQFTTVYDKRVRNHTPGPDGAYSSLAEAWLAAE